MNMDALLAEARSAQAQGNADLAILLYGRILTSYPQYADALRQMGVLFGESGRYEEAAHTLERAVAQEPGNAYALTALGAAYSELGRFAEAEAVLDRALAIAPGMPVAHWNRAGARLPQNDYPGGFADYEWGVAAGMRPVRTLRPQWDGGRDFGGTLTLWSEQGFGDTIQFSRFWRKAALKMGASRIILEVYPELVQLYQAQGWEGVTVVAKPMDHHLPHAFHQHASLFSLPYLLGMEPDNIPSGPYLKAPENLRTAWAERLQGDFKVGLCWAGRPSHANDARRSAPFKALVPLLSIEGATFYSLQVGERAAEAKGPIVNLGAELTDFSVTAAVMANLDLVITCDSAIAHLAGALGVPCWVLLPHVADWRWQIDTYRTPWYEGMRLFRQSLPDAWPQVIAIVLKALKRAIGTEANTDAL